MYDDSNHDMLGCLPFFAVAGILLILALANSDSANPNIVNQMVTIERIDNENKFILKTKYLNNTIMDTALIDDIDSIKLSRKIEGEAIIKKAEDLRKK